MADTDADKRRRGWPESSLGSNYGAPPPEPPMSPSGKSYYTPGDDPREGKDPLSKKDRKGR